MKPFLIVLGSWLLVSCHRVEVSPLSPVGSPPVERTTVGNGSEIPPPDRGSAWFLGPRPVRYCFLIGEGFGLESRDLEGILEASFSEWKSYLSRIGINDPVRYPERVLAGESRGLYLNSTPMKRCDGSEDLQFLFGVENRQVKDALSAYHHPIGVAVRTHFDRREGWGKGWIWISEPARYPDRFPNWGSAPYVGLRGTILHEIGHVLGCSHVKNTIIPPTYGLPICRERSSRD